MYLWYMRRTYRSTMYAYLVRINVKSNVLLLLLIRV